MMITIYEGLQADMCVGTTLSRAPREEALAFRDKRRERREEVGRGRKKATVIIKKQI